MVSLNAGRGQIAEAVFRQFETFIKIVLLSCLQVVGEQFPLSTRTRYFARIFLSKILTRLSFLSRTFRNKSAYPPQRVLSGCWKSRTRRHCQPVRFGTVVGIDRPAFSVRSRSAKPLPSYGQSGKSDHRGVWRKDKENITAGGRSFCLRKGNKRKVGIGKPQAAHTAARDRGFVLFRSGIDLKKILGVPKRRDEKKEGHPSFFSEASSVSPHSFFSNP